MKHSLHLWEWTYYALKDYATRMGRVCQKNSFFILKNVTPINWSFKNKIILGLKF